LGKFPPQREGCKEGRAQKRRFWCPKGVLGLGGKTAHVGYLTGFFGFSNKFGGPKKTQGGEKREHYFLTGGVFVGENFNQGFLKTRDEVCGTSGYQEDLKQGGVLGRI